MYLDRERDKELDIKLKDLQGAVDKRFESVDRRFESMDRRFESIENRLKDIGEGVARINGLLSSQK